MGGARIGVRSRARRPTRLGWALATVTPWCAAMAVLISFAADAGQETRLAMSQSAALGAIHAPTDLVPVDGAFDTGFGLHLGRRDAVVQQARLVIGDPAEFQIETDEIEPNTAMKAQTSSLPAIDRTHKGDPAVGLRPTFDSHMRTPGSLDRAARAGLVFGEANPAAQPMDFGPVDGAPPGPESVARFAPLPGGAALTTAPSKAGASPSQQASATTPHAQDGSTPAVARAASLMSTTPTPDDSTPIEIGALPKFSRGPHGVVAAGQTVVGIEPAHPDFATLVDAAKTASEQKCLATAIYFEARSEPEEGQAAVAQVILNRVASGLYPTSVCGVVFQNQQRRNACQFSFACEGHGLRVTDQDSWSTAVRVAREVTDGTAYVSDVGASTHYHANYVRPIWAARLTKMDRIGHHIFYKLKPGQT